MTMIDPTPATPVTAESLALSEEDKLRLDLHTLQTTNTALRDSLYRERAHVRELYESLTSGNTDNVTEDDSLTYGELSELLERIFGNPLTFVKNYNVSIQYTVCIEATVKAASRQDARDLAENIELNLDDCVNFDDEVVEIDELYVDETNIQKVMEA